MRKTSLEKWATVAEPPAKEPNEQVSRSVRIRLNIVNYDSDSYVRYNYTRGRWEMYRPVVKEAWVEMDWAVFINPTCTGAEFIPDAEVMRALALCLEKTI